MVKNPLIRKVPKMTGKTTGGHKSAGILDDHAVRKNIATRQGTITKTPTADNDIANKKYVDDTAGNYVLKAGDTMTGTLYLDGPVTGLDVLRSADIGINLSVGQNITVDGITYVGDVNFTAGGSTMWAGCDANGGYIDVLGDKEFHISISGTDYISILGTGEVGIGTDTPSEALDVVGNAEINGNIIVTGTVDGIDIATDVAANTTHRGDNTQAHTDYLKNDAVDVGVGLTLTGDNSSADTQYTAQVLYGTDAEPPPAENYPIGTLYVQYTP